MKPAATRIAVPSRPIAFVAPAAAGGVFVTPKSNPFHAWPARTRRRYSLGSSGSTPPIPRLTAPSTGASARSATIPVWMPCGSAPNARASSTPRSSSGRIPSSARDRMGTRASPSSSRTRRSSASRTRQAWPAASTPPVCAWNACAVAPAAPAISWRFASNVAADPLVSWNTEPRTSELPNSCATASVLPSVSPISRLSAPFRPLVWIRVSALTSPSPRMTSRSAGVGFSSPIRIALSCVDTSAVLPVTPLSVA